jgi:hypothetical protein
MGYASTMAWILLVIASAMIAALLALERRYGYRQ